jgi:hypothetical protein
MVTFTFCNIWTINIKQEWLKILKTPFIQNDPDYRKIIRYPPLRPNNILQNHHFHLEVIAFNYTILNPFDAEPASD